MKISHASIILSLGLILGLGLGKLTLEPEVIVKSEIVVEEKEIIVNKYHDMKFKEMLNFMRLVECEATAGDIKHKRNVAHVILNRVESNQFPDTINEVIFQDGQFSPVSDKRFYSIKVSDSTAKAVQQAISGVKNHDCTYFMVRRWSGENNVKWFDEKLEFTFNDGLHEYFKE